jgi:hypothetical protein
MIVTNAATTALEKNEIDRVKRTVYKYALRRAGLHAYWCLMLLKGSGSLRSEDSVEELKGRMMDLNMDIQM